MAIRVKKLARELNQSPGEVLGLLHHLGFTRYRTPEDMIAGPVAIQARKAARAGVRGTPVNVAAPPRRKTPLSPGATGAAAPERDLMAALVPGVVPTRGRVAPAQGRAVRATLTPPSAEASPTLPAPADPGASGAGASQGLLVAERTALEARRDALEADRLALRADQAALDADRLALDVDRAALDADRVALDADRAALDAHHAAISEDAARISDDSLAAVLHARGLRGADEGERAVAALAANHELGPVLSGLMVSEPGLLLRRLQDRLLLVGGDVPAELGLAAVTVSPDRAELPGAGDLRRQLGRLGDQLLLSGLRVVLVVGVPRRWHALLRAATDARVELEFQPGGTRTISHLNSDRGRADALLGWDLEASDGVRDAYVEAGIRWLPATGPALVRWSRELIVALDR